MQTARSPAMIDQWFPCCRAVPTAYATADVIRHRCCHSSYQNHSLHVLVSFVSEWAINLCPLLDFCFLIPQEATLRVQRNTSYCLVGLFVHNRTWVGLSSLNPKGPTPEEIVPGERSISGTGQRNETIEYESLKKLFCPDHISDLSSFFFPFFSPFLERKKGRPLG